MQSYEFEGFEFRSINVKFETYDTEWHRGIIYYTEEGKFDIVFNKVNWPRIIINYKDGSSKDVPFNSSTVELLPPSIKVRKINES